MINGIVSRVLHWFRTRSWARDEFRDVMSKGAEVEHIYDRILHFYVMTRFGPDASRVARILEEYSDWLLTAEMRIHVVSLDEEKVLIPIRLLDALAAELNIAPNSDACPPWTCEAEQDAKLRPPSDFRSLAADPAHWIRVLERERVVLHTLAVRYQLLGEGAT